MKKSLLISNKMNMDVFKTIIDIQELNESFFINFMPFKIKNNFLRTYNSKNNRNIYNLLFFMIKTIFFLIIIYFTLNKYMKKYSVISYFLITFIIIIEQFLNVSYKVKKLFNKVNENHFMKLSLFKNGNVLVKTIGHYVNRSFIYTHIPITLYFYISGYFNIYTSIVYFLITVILYMNIKIIVYEYLKINLLNHKNNFLFNLILKILLLVIFFTLFVILYAIFYKLTGLNILYDDINISNSILILLYLSILFFAHVYIFNHLSFSNLSINIYKKDMGNSKKQKVNKNIPYLNIISFGLSSIEKVILKKDIKGYTRKERGKKYLYFFLLISILILSFMPLSDLIKGTVDNNSVFFVDTIFINMIVFFSIWFFYLIKETTWYSSENNHIYIYSHFNIKKYEMYKIKKRLNIVITLPLVLLYNFILLLSFAVFNEWTIIQTIYRILYSLLLLYGRISFIIYKDTINPKSEDTYYDANWIGNNMQIFSFGVILFLQIFIYAIFYEQQKVLMIGNIFPIMYIFILIVANIIINLKSKKLKKIRV